MYLTFQEKMCSHHMKWPCKQLTYFKLDASLIEKTDGSKFQQRAKRPPKTGFIIDKAVNELAYNPHSFMEGIEILSKQVAEQAK